jgi:hypothetical protein
MKKLSILLMTIILLSSCGRNYISVEARGPTIVGKRYEAERHFFKDRVDNSGTTIEIVPEPWLDGEDFILVINDGGTEILVYTTEVAYNLAKIGDEINLVNSELYFFVDFNNKKL